MTIPLSNNRLRDEFVKFLKGKKTPDAFATLTTRYETSEVQLIEKLKELRKASESLHPVGCRPSRSFRKIEFLAVLEYGDLPKNGAAGRLHAHALLYNLNSIPLESLARKWRSLTNSYRHQEPLIERFDPDRDGVRYVLKTIHNQPDRLIISDGLAKWFNSPSAPDATAPIQTSARTPDGDDETAVFLFQETPYGDVMVTTPEGETLLLDCENQDGYWREAVLVERVVKGVSKQLHTAAARIQRKPEPPPISGEHLYTPQELAKLTSLDASTIRRMFVEESGVIKLGRQNRRDGKRDYVTLRIPASVAERVLRGKMNRR